MLGTVGAIVSICHLWLYCVVLESCLLRAEADVFLTLNLLFLSHLYFSLAYILVLVKNLCWGEKQGPLTFFLISPVSPQAKMPFDANKLYCSEVLAILLQDNDGEAPS